MPCNHQLYGFTNSNKFTNSRFTILHPISSSQAGILHHHISKHPASNSQIHILHQVYDFTTSHLSSHLGLYNIITSSQLHNSPQLPLIAQNAEIFLFPPFLLTCHEFHKLENFDSKKVDLRLHNPYLTSPHHHIITFPHHSQIITSHDFTN